MRLTSNLNAILRNSTIKALNSKLIYSVADFLVAEPQFIERTCDLTFKEILTIRLEFLRQFACKPQNGLTLYKHTLQNSALISTGLSSLDELLDGGLLTGQIYELSGRPASGKTLFCLNLTKSLLTSSTEHHVVYLDTKKNVSGRKFHALCPTAGKALIMQRLLIKDVTNRYELINSLYELKNELEKGLQARLVIIDCLASIFMQFPEGHEENNGILNNFANVLRVIVKQFHVAVLVTNIVTVWVPGDFLEKEVKETVSCGKFWSSIPDVLLKIVHNEDFATISLRDIACKKNCVNIRFNKSVIEEFK